MAEEKKQPTLRTKPEQEGELIELLKSEASRKEKADACRELSRYSTTASVDTLIGLLDDDEMAHMARYALETNPEPGVDEGLRAALGNLKGLHLARRHWERRRPSRHRSRGKSGGTAQIRR